MELPQPDPAVAQLADVVPSVLAAMGVNGFEPRIPLQADLRGACVLLVDGLGAELLDTYAGAAPVLAGLRGPKLQVGFPSTTAASLTTLGTGCRSGEHGMVGMSFRAPDGWLLNALRWRPHPWGPDLMDDLPPEQLQPLPTTFERAVVTGVAVSVISAAEFEGSGLTRAALRGGRYCGTRNVDDVSTAVRAALADGGFSYAYYSELDLAGHIYGPGSEQWLEKLREVDRLVESIIETLPSGSMLAVIADHGMIAVDPVGSVDIDASPELLVGVQAVGGEPRARHVYTEPGAADDVLAAWSHRMGQNAWVAARDEAIAAGWFGPRISDLARARIGEVVVAARDRAVMVRSAVEPMESALIGHHGSLTSAEQLVPLLLAHPAHE